MISEILKAIPGVEVVGASFDGEDCLTMAEKLKPDLITLDMQMPRRDGLSTLEEIKRRKLRAEVIMVCSQTIESAEQTLQAFRIGALDMILKPDSSDFAANKKDLETQLLNQVLTVRARSGKRVTSASASRIRTQPPIGSAFRTTNTGLVKPPKCVCIGVSTGGPQALGVVMQSLPGDLPVPLFIVQQMPPHFTKSLADHLNRSGKIRVSEAVDGEIAINGKVYIAPGGKHMKVEKCPLGFKIRVTNDAPVGSCKPSVDYLFNSVNECVGGEALAIILTGMGNDGLAGCKRLHTSGAMVIAQDADSCVVYGMPRQIAENNLAHEVLPLSAIASKITQVLSKQSVLCS
jgi:two-component system chemotaxis response regulator CheB